MNRKMLKGLFVYFTMVFLLSGCGMDSTSGNARVDIESNPSEFVIGLEMESETKSASVAGTSIDSPVTTAESSPFREEVFVTGNHVNIRKEALLSSEVITRVNRGTVLQQVGVSGEWSKVLYQEQSGYIMSGYLSKEPVEVETVAAESDKTGKKVAIDPGHQGKGNFEKEPVGPGASVMKAKVTTGTQGVATGLAEYKLNLEVSLKLKSELEKRGYEVYMIRESHDVNISNVQRAEMANNSGADVFVRVHANSLDDGRVHGTLTMCQTSKNPYNSDLYLKSSALSKAITDGICQTTGFKNRGVQETDSMSGINWCRIPVSIVEMGFMSNAEEDKKMASEEYQIKIAQGIADGIDSYFKDQ